MAITVAQPADSSVEPAPSDFAARVTAEVRDAAQRIRDARIEAATSRLVAFRAARGRP